MIIARLEQTFNRSVKEVSIESISFPESFAIISVTIKNSPMKEKMISLTPYNKLETVLKQSSSHL